MPRIKTVDAIDRQIQQVQADLIRVKARMDRLTAELRGLELERRKRQADVLLAALAKSGKTLDDVLTFLGR